jgi:single-stranded-DNA-specific exonuclease
MLPLKRWKVLNTDANKSLIEVLLKNRNLDQQHLNKFKLSEKLHDPYLLEDMDKAVTRILKAIRNKEKVTVYGDYDVDGVTSTVLMVKLFQKLNYEIAYLVPHREKDGYGLKIPGIDEALKIKTDLLITVDNGISSHEAIHYANESGMDVIVTDHHLQEGELPAAFAVINPNRKDSKYPFKGICGAGVVYKLIHAIAQHELANDHFKNFMLTNLDLLCLATIADMVPLIDENYAICKFGLKALEETMRPGLVELKKVSGVLGKAITPMTIGFYLAPRINAAGRLQHASIAVELLLSETIDKAKNLVAELNSLNSKRQVMQQSYIEDVIFKIEQQEMHDQKMIIVEDENWSPGLVGLISGRIKEKYYLPSMAFTTDEDGNYVGSARSIDNFNITNALTQFNHLFINYGGHEKAAGVTIAAENYQRFKNEIINYAEEHISEEDLIQNLLVDSFVGPEQLNESIIRMISEIGPFGEGNPEPVIAMENVKINDIRLMGQDKHLKILISKGSQDFECVWWQRGDLKNVIRFGMKADIAFKPSINTWNGTKKIQCIIEDLRPNQV